MLLWFTTKYNLYSHVIKVFGLENSTASQVLMVAFVVLCIAVAYLLGSVNTAIIISGAKYHDDVRSHGSGNAGATNVLRTYGKKAALFTFLGDMLKAVLAVVITSFLLSWDLGGAIGGLFVILGHMFPVFYKFKGGKGVSCLCAVVLISCPPAFLVLITIFLILCFAFKYVSLASIMAALLYPLMALGFLRIFDPFGKGGLIPAAAVLIAIFVVFMHRENIGRLLRGKESKLSLLVKLEEKKKQKKLEKARARAAARGEVLPEDTESMEPPERIYKANDFTVCRGCGSTIPKSRKTCVYCGTDNPDFTAEDEELTDGKKRKK